MTTQHRIDLRDNGATLITVQIDIWTYDFGPGEFVRVLTFENDFLHYVETGDYGTP